MKFIEKKDQGRILLIPDFIYDKVIKSDFKKLLDQSKQTSIAYYGDDYRIIDGLDATEKIAKAYEKLTGVYTRNMPTVYMAIMSLLRKAELPRLELTYEFGRYKLKSNGMAFFMNGFYKHSLNNKRYEGGMPKFY